MDASIRDCMRMAVRVRDVRALSKLAEIRDDPALLWQVLLDRASVEWFEEHLRYTGAIDYDRILANAVVRCETVVEFLDWLCTERGACVPSDVHSCASTFRVVRWLFGHGVPLLEENWGSYYCRAVTSESESECMDDLEWLYANGARPTVDVARVAVRQASHPQAVLAWLRDREQTWTDDIAHSVLVRCYFRNRGEVGDCIQLLLWMIGQGVVIDFEFCLNVARFSTVPAMAQFLETIPGIREAWPPAAYDIMRDHSFDANARALYDLALKMGLRRFEEP